MFHTLIDPIQFKKNECFKYYLIRIVKKKLKRRDIKKEAEWDGNKDNRKKHKKTCF